MQILFCADTNYNGIQSLASAHRELSKLRSRRHTDRFKLQTYRFILIVIYLHNRAAAFLSHVFCVLEGTTYPKSTMLHIVAILPVGPSLHLHHRKRPQQYLACYVKSHNRYRPQPNWRHRQVQP